MNLIKKLVIGRAVVALMLSLCVPAMADVCQPTDVDCVEPSADTPSDTPPGPQPQTQCGFIQIGTGPCYPDPNWDSNVYHPPYDPCTDALQNGNASQGKLQYADPGSDISTDDSSITIDPQPSYTCEQTFPQP